MNIRMYKIPTVLVRDPEDRAHVLMQVTPGCEWVFAGEGMATRKYDGTCTMLDASGHWWARREVKPGKAAPVNYVPTGTDETTGKTMGWEPIGQSSFAKAFASITVYPQQPGTYELCGPKVQGNPEGFLDHRLVYHGSAERFPQLDHPVDPESLRGMMPTVWEGVVWHHADGRMAKLKRRDIKTGD